MYEDVAISCFRYLGMKSLDEVDQMTIREYRLLMKANNLKNIDRDYRVHQLAWLTNAARATKSAGKGKRRPVYAKFSQFFDYRNAVRQALGKKKRSRFDGIGHLLKGGR